MATEKVLIIDDDKIARKFIGNSLKGDYEIIMAEDGKAGLLAATEHQPNVILLDVEMPGKNGFEVCDELKLEQMTADIPVIFISGKSSLRERILSFEVGGDDYLVKPCEKEIIQAKVSHIIQQHAKQKMLSEEANQAFRTAQDAMQGSAELGTAIRFVSSTYIMPSFDLLASGMFQVMEELGIHTSLMMLTAEGYKFYSHNRTTISPLESELLQMMHGKGRFCDFGHRTICNYPKVALLMKNMPLDDRERYGRLKDTVPFILSAVEEKISALDIQHAILSQAETLARSTEAIRSTIESISMSAADTQHQISMTMKNLIDDFDAKLPTMGLEEDQENYIISRIDESFTQALNTLDEGNSLTGALDSVVRLLAHLMGQQKVILKSSQKTLEVNNAANDNIGDHDGAYASDVELF